MTAALIVARGQVVGHASRRASLTDTVIVVGRR
jgi:hypothetical protein